MEYQIRSAREDDMARVLELIKELAFFEKEPEAVEVLESDLIRDGFGDNRLFHCFVAEVKGTVNGMALVYPRYSTWKGAAIHLEDLIITESSRGTGLGTALLNEVVKYGYELGVKRISWEVLSWNHPAIKFYESKGAKILQDWDVVHLDESGIERYVNSL